ncbi:MAG: hypothetical protein OEL91_06015 [Burkholderiaceae bacterium]|nr:hypothetical protein [Burkholderiaceae bacterium]
MSDTDRWNKGLVNGAVCCAFIVSVFAIAGCAPLGVLSDRGSSPTTYAATIREALQNYASDMQGYYFRATPVGNFGVGSIYLDDVSDPSLSRVESSWFLGGPNDWLTSSVPQADRQRMLKRMIAEGSLGAFSSSSTDTRAINAEAGIAILSMLTGDASLDYRKGVVTSFRASEVINRRLNWAEFQAALNAGHIRPNVADIVKSGEFVLAAADIVLVGYRAEVSVDEKVNPALAVSLRTSILLPQSRSAHASFSLSEGTRGHFVAHAKQPVVAAVLFKRPPPLSTLRTKSIDSAPDIDAWPAAQVQGRSVEAVETRVLKGMP